MISMPEILGMAIAPRLIPSIEKGGIFYSIFPIM